MNRSLAYVFLVLANFVRLWPHLVAMRLAGNKFVIHSDLHRWCSLVFVHPVRDRYCSRFPFLSLMTFYPEFRSLFYYRIGWKSCFIRWLCKPLDSLHFACRQIGPGFFIEHGFSTIIAAKSIGENFWINQQVTIGYQGSDSPTIGNNVKVCAGAKIIGRVTVGDNVVVGANGVVVKDVPQDCIVGGVPARLIRQINSNESRPAAGDISD